MSNAQVPDVLVANARVIIVSPGCQDPACPWPAHLSQSWLSIHAAAALYFPRIRSHALTLREPRIVAQAIERRMQGRAQKCDLETDMKKRSVRIGSCEAGCTTIGEEKEVRPTVVDDLRDGHQLVCQWHIVLLNVQKKGHEVHEYRRQSKTVPINAL